MTRTEKKGIWHRLTEPWTSLVQKGRHTDINPCFAQLCVTAASPDLKLCFTCTFLSIKIYSRVETAFLEKLVNFLKTRDKLKSVVCWCFKVSVQTFHFICIILKTVPQATTWEDLLFQCFMSEKFSYQQWKSCRMFTTSDPSATVLLYLNQLFLRFSVYCWNNKN